MAKRMLKETEQILREKGIGECHLEVREDNSAALKLYQNSGYIKIKPLEKYYGNKHGLFLKETYLDSFSQILLSAFPIWGYV